jgi:glycosyltransferase involved in cell wall biosynthesis
VALPSIRYAIAPKSILEATAGCKPVVASAIGGLPEQIADRGTGRLAEPESIPASAAALSRLAELDDAVLETTIRRARGRASSSFSTDRYYGVTTRLYGRLQEIRRG